MTEDHAIFIFFFFLSIAAPFLSFGIIPIAILALVHPPTPESLPFYVGFVFVLYIFNLFFRVVYDKRQ